jgi:hypothetical protein
MPTAELLRRDSDLGEAWRIWLQVSWVCRTCKGKSMHIFMASSTGRAMEELMERKARLS